MWGLRATNEVTTRLRLGLLIRRLILKILRVNTRGWIALDTWPVEGWWQVGCRRKAEGQSRMGTATGHAKQSGAWTPRVFCQPWIAKTWSTGLACQRDSWWGMRASFILRSQLKGFSRCLKYFECHATGELHCSTGATNIEVVLGINLLTMRVTSFTNIIWEPAYNATRRISLRNARLC